MTSKHFPPIFCLVCGLELGTFDDLQQHVCEREDYREVQRAKRDTLKNR